MFDPTSATPGVVPSCGRSAHGQVGAKRANSAADDGGPRCTARSTATRRSRRSTTRRCRGPSSRRCAQRRRTMGLEVDRRTALPAVSGNGHVAFRGMRGMRGMRRTGDGRSRRGRVRTAVVVVRRRVRGRGCRRCCRRLGGRRRKDRRAEVGDGSTGSSGSRVEVRERGALAVRLSTSAMRIPRRAETLLRGAVEIWTGGGGRGCRCRRVGGRRHERRCGTGARVRRRGGAARSRGGGHRGARRGRGCGCRRSRRRRLGRVLIVGTRRHCVDVRSWIGQVEPDVRGDASDCRLRGFGQGAGCRCSPGSGDEDAGGKGAASDPPARWRTSASTNSCCCPSGGDHRVDGGVLVAAFVGARRGCDLREQGAQRARRRSMIGVSRRHIDQIVRAARGVTRRRDGHVAGRAPGCRSPEPSSRRGRASSRCPWSSGRRASAAARRRPVPATAPQRSP